MWNARRPARVTSPREVGFSLRPTSFGSGVTRQLTRRGVRIKHCRGLFPIVFLCHGTSRRGVRLTGDPIHVLHSTRSKRVGRHVRLSVFTGETVPAESGPKRFSHGTRPACFSATYGFVNYAKSLLGHERRTAAEIGKFRDVFDRNFGKRRTRIEFYGQRTRGAEHADLFCRFFFLPGGRLKSFCRHNRRPNNGQSPRLNGQRFCISYFSVLYATQTNTWSDTRVKHVRLSTS